MSATKTYPEGGSLLQTFKRSFNDVPINETQIDAVSTTEFLEAAESLSGLFDVLGSMAFQPVKKDILGNVKKVRDRQAAAPTKSKYLQDLVRDELSMKRHTATEGLVWLVRGLDFTALALSQNLADSSEELSKSFRSAYTVTLQPHHSVFVKPIFSAALMACPYRKDFYASLGKDEDQVVEELKVWLAALQKVLAILKKFLKSSEAKW